MNLTNNINNLGLPNLGNSVVGGIPSATQGFVDPSVLGGQFLAGTQDPNALL